MSYNVITNRFNGEGDLYETQRQIISRDGIDDITYRDRRIDTDITINDMSKFNTTYLNASDVAISLLVLDHNATNDVIAKNHYRLKDTDHVICQVEGIDHNVVEFTVLKNRLHHNRMDIYSTFKSSFFDFGSEGKLTSRSAIFDLPVGEILIRYQIIEAIDDEDIMYSIIVEQSDSDDNVITYEYYNIANNEGNIDILKNLVHYAHDKTKEEPAIKYDIYGIHKLIETIEPNNVMIDIKGVVDGVRTVVEYRRSDENTATYSIEIISPDEKKKTYYYDTTEEVANKINHIILKGYEDINYICDILSKDKSK